jgi:hypothetical protein
MTAIFGISLVLLFLLRFFFSSQQQTTKQNVLTLNLLLQSVWMFYERGRSFFSRYNAHNETLATLTTLKRTPGMSPTA